MKHLRELNDFSKTGKVNESVRLVGSDYLVMRDIIIPKALVSAYIKKVKDDSGQDIKSFYGDEIIAEKIVQFIETNLINIDNLPTSIVLGDATQKVQIQPQVQHGQSQGQTQAQPGQSQGQTQAQPTQAQPTQAQPAEKTAQEIPAQEGGTQGQKVQGQSTQSQAPQGQAQNTHEI